MSGLRILLALLSCVGITSAATNAELSAIASKDLGNYLKTTVAQIPSPSDFNLSDQASVDRAVLGSPVQLLAINDGADTISLTAKVSGFTMPANRWYLPVIVDGSTRFFIAVSDMVGNHGGLMRSAAGFAYLAAEYDRISAAWPNHDIALVTVPSTGRYFFTIRDLGRENMTALRSPLERGSIIAPNAAPPPQDYSQLGSASDAITVLRADKVNGGVK